MKFLRKFEQSEIKKSGLIYRRNNAANNNRLKELLLLEQKNYCAYTEKYITSLDSSEVEHFDSSKKYKDDYYNYYAVIRSANLFKKDEKYREAKFFSTRFFQNPESLNQRIKYEDGVFYVVTTSDNEAAEFIDFIGLNHPRLYQERSNYIKRIKTIFAEANFDKGQCLNYFRSNREDLHFITAAEVELDIDLSEFYNS